jgi:hypothetical protein
MMKIRQLFQYRCTHLGAVLTTAAALLILGSVNPAFAKKGGGGKPGGEDPPAEDPPAELPPISATSIDFDVRLFDGKADASPNAPWANAAEVYVYFDDINRDGAAIGQAWVPNGDGLTGTGYGIIATVGGGIEQLDDIFATALTHQDFDGLRIQGAWEINGAGQIACTLTDDVTDARPIAIADLRNSSLTWVNTVTNVPYYYPIKDLNESGDVLTYERFTVSGTGKKRNQQQSYQHFHWLSVADGNGGWNAPVHLSQVETSYPPQLNSTPMHLAYLPGNDTIRRTNLLTGEDSLVTETLGSGFAINLRIADDGAVYLFQNISSNSETQGYPARWTEDGGLQPLAGIQPGPTGSVLTILDVSKSIVGLEPIEVLMGTGGSANFDLEIYQSDENLGVRYPVGVTAGDLAGWDATGHEVMALSRPNASGHGLVCGQAKDGTFRKGFILTPVAP